VNGYHQSVRIQNQLADNRIRFSQRLNEMSDELLALAREGEKLRKLASPPRHGVKPKADHQHKENGIRYQSILQESEVAMEKVCGDIHLRSLELTE
jgi:hypothetical protein